LQSPDPAPEESPEPAQKQPLAAASDAGSNPTESPGNAGSPLPSNSKTGNPSSYPPLGNPMPNPMNQANNPYNNPSGNPLNNPLNNPGNRQGGDILRPAVVSKVEPKYSQEAKSFRYSGTSVLSVVVDERGIPGDIRVLRQAGYGLDKQAAEAVSRWRFSPGLRNGVPIRYRLGVQVNFRYAGVFSFARSSLFFQ
jgi:TonB family protein